jgi:elongation factor P--(R)-beta-lysine ligase
MTNTTETQNGLQELLFARAQVMQRVRQFFEQRQLLEVVTPVLSHDTVVDRHLDPFTTIYAPDPRRPTQGETLYLQTSPEFAMKRLLASGVGSIFQFAHAFRNGEVGPLHQPEFTLLEWYRVGDNYQQGMQLLSDLAEVLFARGPARVRTYCEVFAEVYQLNPLTANLAELQAAATTFQLSPPESLGTDRDGWLDFLLTERIQSRLGCEQPVILCDYPPSQAALARVRNDEQPVAERFELFVDGIELANGYHELLDPRILAERNRVNNLAREADGKPTLPCENRLLTAMQQGLPPCAGCALGFDRALLVMWKKTSLTEVIPFGFHEV